MAYFLKVLQQVLDCLRLRLVHQDDDLLLQNDCTRLIKMQEKLNMVSSLTLSDDDLAFCIDLGMRYAPIVTIEQQNMSLWVAWVESSAQMGIHYADWRLAKALLSRASQIRSQRLDQILPRVAIFGSSFNPITSGHLDFIHILLQQDVGNFSKVYLIPSGQSPFKSAQEYASVPDRLQMIHLALASQSAPQDRARLSIETVEVLRSSPSWMVMTLAAIILMYRGEASYVLTCGYDHLCRMQQWHAWQAMADLTELWFYPRSDIEIVTDSAVNACMALCEADIPVTLFFTQNDKKQAFYDLYRARSRRSDRDPILIWDPNASIRPSSATDIRDFYQKGDTHQFEPPAGICLEVHRYILEHQCYHANNLAITTPKKNRRTKPAKTSPPGTQ